MQQNEGEKQSLKQPLPDENDRFRSWMLAPRQARRRQAPLVRKETRTNSYKDENGFPRTITSSKFAPLLLDDKDGDDESFKPRPDTERTM